MTIAYFTEQDQRDADTFWSTREFKTFAVDVFEFTTRNKAAGGHTYYASARDKAGAIDTIKNNCGRFLPKRRQIRVRLAGPIELGCVPTKPQQQEAA